MSKQDVKNEWRQLDVDLMLWHYAVGLVETANLLDGGTMGNLNALVVARKKHLVEVFKIEPSFGITIRPTVDKKFIAEKGKPI